MRKHNRRFAQRWPRDKDDRTNFPQTMAHGFVKNKGAQFYANFLLQGLLARSGISPLAL